MWLFFLFLQILTLCFEVDGAGQTEYYNLVNHLFDNYNKNVRPTTSGEGTVVKMNMVLKAINALDEKHQVMETYATLNVEWNDDYLRWNTSDFGSISRILYPQKQLWLPDIINENSVESQAQLGYDQLQVAIENDGSVIWRPSEIFKTACDIDISFYPFDSQTCHIIFRTMMSTSTEIDIDPYALDAEIDLSDYSLSSVWELVSTSVETPVYKDSYTRIKFVLKLERLRRYYVINLLFPVLLLASSSSMVFYLPAESGEKISMGITVLLSYTVYLTILADKIPETSREVSLLGTYITILLFVSSLTVVMSVVVLNIHHRDDDIPIPPYILEMTRRLRRSIGLAPPLRLPVDKNKIEPTQTAADGTKIELRMRLSSNISRDGLSDSHAKELQNANNKITHCNSVHGNQQYHSEHITWSKVAQTMDRIFFFGSLTITIASTVILIPLMSILAAVM